MFAYKFTFKLFKAIFTVVPKLSGLEPPFFDFTISSHRSLKIFH
jgi:hypothetical protein